jgi:hypothetical protein
MSEQYRWKKGRWELGPASLDDMQKMVRSGALSRAQSVSKDGGKSWAPAAEFSEIWDTTATVQHVEPLVGQGVSPPEDHNGFQFDGDALFDISASEDLKKKPAQGDGGYAVAGFVAATVALVLLGGLAFLWLLRLSGSDWVMPASFVLLMPAVAGIVLSVWALSRGTSGLAKAGLANGICGSILGLALSFGAMASHEGGPSDADASPSPGSANSAGEDLASAERKSLFHPTSYRMRAVLVNTDQRPVPLESLTVYASPKSVVQRQLSSAIARHQQELKDWDSRRKKLTEHLEKTKSRLAAEEADVTEEYNIRRPKQGAEDVLALRDPLDVISEMRTSKSKADDWFEQAMSSRIEPIKSDIAKTERAINESLNQQWQLQSELRDRVFKAISQVPATQRKQWKTGKDGYVSVDVSATEPWTVWAVAEHEKYIGKNIVWSSSSTKTGAAGWSSSGAINAKDVVQTKQVRWILDVPDDLDDNNLLTLDLGTAFEAFVVSVESDGEEGPYLRKHRAAR